MRRGGEWAAACLGAGSGWYRTAQAAGRMVPARLPRPARGMPSRPVGPPLPTPVLPPPPPSPQVRRGHPQGPVLQHRPVGCASLRAGAVAWGQRPRLGHRLAPASVRLRIHAARPPPCSRPLPWLLMHLPSSSTSSSRPSNAGGTTMFPGIADRMGKEITALAPSSMKIKGAPSASRRVLSAGNESQVAGVVLQPLLVASCAGCGLRRRASHDA